MKNFLTLTMDRNGFQKNASVVMTQAVPHPDIYQRFCIFLKSKLRKWFKVAL